MFRPIRDPNKEVVILPEKPKDSGAGTQLASAVADSPVPLSPETTISTTLTDGEKHE